MRILTWPSLVILLLHTGTALAGGFECLIEPRQVVALKSSVEGLIERIHVDRGDVVKQGQVLIELDAGVDTARLDLARFKAGMEGAIHAAESRVDFAAKKLQRQQDLYQQKFVSTHDRDEAEANKNQAEAELLEARDNKRLAQLEVHEYEETLRLKTIRSPVNGVVMERSHHPGEVTHGGDDQVAILKLAEIDPLYVEVILPVSTLGKINVGESVKILPEVPVSGQFTAQVKVVDQVVDAASGTFGVRLELPNPGYRIPAGIRCEAVFPHAEFTQPARVSDTMPRK
jgi:RND family efflux transporter MFP subunit